MNRNGRDSWSSRFLPWLAFIVLPCLVFWKALLLRGSFFILDAMVLNFPLRTWAASRMLEGRLPLWCPEIACGFPLFAEGQAGVLYLPNWPFFALMPAHHAAAWSTILHFILAGLFTCGYLRALRCRPAAALLGGLAFQWGGFLVLRALFLNMINTVVWLPALCWLAEHWLARPEKRRGTVAMMTVVITLVLLAGHPQAAAYTLVFWWLLFLWRALPLIRGGWKNRRALLVPLLLVPLAATGLAAVQLVPTLELTRVSARAGGIREELLMHSSLPPTHLAALILPGLFGEPADGSWRAAEDGFYWELQAWPGIIPLYLALLAALALRSPPARFHACAAIVALVLALGKYTFFGKLLVWLPLLQNFRIPARFLFIFGFSAAVLAGLGLETLLAAAGRQGDGPIWNRPALRRSGAIITALLSGCIVAVIAVNGAALLRPAAFRGGAQLLRDLLLVPVLALALGALVHTARRHRRGPAMLAAGAILLTLLDLGIHGWGYNRTIDPAVYRTSPRTVCLARQEIGGRGRQRVAGLVNDSNSALRWHDGWDLDPQNYRTYFSTLHMYGPTAFGLETACFDAWSPLQILRYRELNRLPLDTLLDLAGVGIVASPRLPAGRYEALLEEPGFTLYRNPDPLPRVQLVHRAWLIHSVPRMLACLADPLFDPRREIVLDGPDGETRSLGAASLARPEDEARIIRYEDRLVEVEYQTAAEGWLCLGDTWYPGWEAELDGEAVPILRANVAFRAIRAPAGTHTVVFSYRPASLILGLWISALSALLLLPLALVLAGLGHQAPLADGPLPPAWKTRWPQLIALAAALLVLLVSIALRWPLWQAAFQGLELPPL
jgi:hypothetical protein